ncbi:MAG: DUF5777 family beta-barrel protein [Candidatus Aminicenantes bacterium]|nr:DUF5777 family beta-barrel protein [Candidatus Aminicenantes bacterium]
MKSKFKVIYLILFFVIFFFSGSQWLKGLEKKDMNIPANEDLQKNAAQIFKKNCSTAGCHSGAYPPMNLNLEKDRFAKALLNIPSQEIPSLKLVDTDNPEKSYLLMKIKGETSIVGKRMPAGSPALKENDIQTIEDWISSLSYSQTGGNRIIIEQAKIPDKSGKKELKKPAFWGTQLINLPTTHSLGKGNVLFRVSHRYVPSIASGYDSFYGLDGPAVILLSLGYGISDNLSLTLARTKLNKEVELSFKWVMFGQRTKSKLPLSGALNIGGSWATESLTGREVFDADNMKFNAQAIFSYQLNNSISVALVPAFSSNTNHWEPASEGTFALGTGGRFMVFEDLSIIWEWIPVLSGYQDNEYGWALGIEKKIGGHVFQVFILNSAGLTSDQFLPGGDLRLKDGDLRFGFNIFRTF